MKFFFEILFTGAFTEIKGSIVSLFTEVFKC